MVSELLFLFLTSLVLNLLIATFAVKFSLFLDKPAGGRKIHNRPVPRTGGMAIYGSVLLLSLLKKLSFGVKLNLSALPLVGIAIFEDFNELSPYTRFVFIFFSAALAVFSLNAVVLNVGFFSLPYWVGVLFTIFAVVGAVNAFNIVDGLNGLVSGISVVVLLTYAYLFCITGRETEAYWALAVAVATLGFFVLNFLKGLIFLGDTGSYYLGYTCGILSVLLAGTGKEVSPWVPMVVMFYPVWETVYSIKRRLSEGKSPFYPDKEHLHFLLYRFFKNSHVKATLSVLLFEIFLSLLSVLFYKNTLALFGIFLLAAMLYTLLYRFLKKKV
jgi:UDP-N-acetylmuramyl pentapeptide phosphotransferase/UDP-N-acetylglucosamine-1-phosphate transferase